MTSANARSPDRNETTDERADRNWIEIVQELRVTQTGTQILSGFLLAVAFEPVFGSLHVYQRVTYLTLVAIAATTTTVGLVPVSLHRHMFRQHEKPRLVTLADRLLKVVLTMVSLLTAGVVFFVFSVTVGFTGAWIAGIVVAAGMIGSLLIYPRIAAPKPVTSDDHV
jgi:hypothetical protein